jgi:glycine/D-amino acid oxidase-like deaminating enzyme
MAELERYEDLVLGSGAGGKLLAWHLAQSGRRTAVVERRWIGGSCPNIAPRSTLILNGLPGATPANLFRMFSMLSSDTTGMPSTERMMSPPRASSFPPMVRSYRRPSGPCPTPSNPGRPS